MHPRNQHRNGYDFAALVRTYPELGRFLQRAPHGDWSIDFAKADAVKALNRALLAHHYGVRAWDIPAGYLCPPVPGRADYIHAVADLLASDNQGRIPRGPGVAVLDIGVGANCIFPLVGHREYGWRFVGTEVDASAFRNANAILRANPDLRGAIEVRRQPAARHIFRGVVHGDERFALSICNPPFHASAEDAARGTQRKLRNLGRSAKTDVKLNFGGTATELWCPGGELSFVRRIISESAAFGHQFGWFTTLVSSREHVRPIEGILAAAGAIDVRTVPLAQGQKKSRIIAWRFTTRREPVRAGASASAGSA